MRVPLRGTRALSALAFVAALGVTACSHAPVKTATTPAAVSSIFVRNSSAFEVNVYAVPRANAAPIWLATVPAKTSWQVPIPSRGLQADGELVVRTQAIGSARFWTSAPVSIDTDNFGLLDLTVSSTGDCSMSALRSVNAAELTPWM
jgi:hypothetical protein